MRLAPITSELSFLWRWTLATISGFLLSLLVIEIGEKPDVTWFGAAMGGLAIALSQSVILRRPIFSWRWVLSSLLGWAIITATGIGAVGWIVPTTPFLPLRLLSGAFDGAIGGFVIGFCQWLAIYPQNHSAWPWILISAASWSVAIPVGSTVGFILHYFTQLFLGEVVGLAITWLVVAILTGINAYKLLK